MKENDTILLIDDDERLQNVIKDYLEPHGFEIVSLYSGEGVNGALAEACPDLVLLDVMLPGDDGFTVLGNIRAQSDLPVIMLTAKGDDADRIAGLELGADDYLPKPFNPRELLARIKAVIRRVRQPEEGGAFSQTGQAGQPGQVGQNGSIDVDGIILNFAEQSLRFGGDSVPLTTAEFNLVKAFLRHAGKVLSRDEILNLAYGPDYYVNDRSIDVHISRIRAILRRLGAPENTIRTVWNTGYTWIKKG